MTILKLSVAGDAWSAQESSVIPKTVKNFPNVVCRVCQNCGHPGEFSSPCFAFQTTLGKCILAECELMVVVMMMMRVEGFLIMEEV